jgi:PAS domain S-box-containing protein
VIASVPAVLLSRIDAASYRSGALAVAFLVVVGLAMRWSVAAGAAPVLWLAMVAQVTDDFAAWPTGRDSAGLAVLGTSLGLVIFALRRWEGDRRRARAEAQARLRNERRLQALVDLARDLGRATSRPALLTVLELHTVPSVGAAGAVLVTRDHDHMEFPFVVGHDAERFPARLPVASPRAAGPALDALRTGAPAFLGSTVEVSDRYPSLAEYVELSGHRAWAVLPIRPLGALVLTWREEQAFSPAQRAFLTTVANLVTATAERIDDVERAELQRFVGAFDSMLDGVGIHRAVRDASGRVVDFEIEYLNPASVNAGDRPAELVGQRISEVWGASPFLRHYVSVVETGVPYVLEDADVRALGGPFSDVEAISLRASRLDAERIVIVVRDVTERAHLVRAMHAANEMLTLAQELAHVGGWTYDFTTDRLEWSPELYRIVGVEPGAAPPRPRDGSLLGFEHPDDRGVIAEAVGAAIDSRAPFAFDVRVIRQHDGEIRDVTTTGIVLTDERGTVVGVRGATQDVTDRTRVERSRQAALAALAHQRAAVAALQRVILPPTLPAIAGAELCAHYRAATRSEAVGGDWYDAFTTGDGHVVLAIGDVAGHGVECAALANQLRVSVRVRVGDGMGPGETLALLDQELPDGFVTSWIASYDPATRIVRYASAGHLPAVLVRCGAARTAAGRTAPPLGGGLVVAPAEEEVALQPGDLLVLCTDGLVERRGEDLALGLARLVHVAPTVADKEDPAHALVEHLAPDAADDVCVLTLRIR